MGWLFLVEKKWSKFLLSFFVLYCFFRTRGRVVLGRSMSGLADKINPNMATGVGAEGRHDAASIDLRQGVADGSP